MQLTLGTFKGLRFAGALLLLIVGLILGLAYWSSVEQHRRYLTSRNFRLLAVLAKQTQNLIDGQGRIFSGLLADPNTFVMSPSAAKRSADRKGNELPTWLSSRIAFIPSLQHLDTSHVRTTVNKVVKATVTKHRIETERGRSSLRVGVYAGKKSEEVLSVRLNIAGLLEPIFAPKLRQGAFDTLVFATQEGQVVFTTG